jgi:hypothetical protein
VYAALAWLAGIAPEDFADPAVHQLAGRLVSAIAGALLVPAVYRLGRVRFGRGACLLAAAAMAVDTAAVITGRQARPHAVVITLLVAAAPGAASPAARGTAAGPPAARRTSVWPRRSSRWARWPPAGYAAPRADRAAAASRGAIGGQRELPVWGGLGLMDRSGRARCPAARRSTRRARWACPPHAGVEADPARARHGAELAVPPALFAAAALYVLARLVSRRTPGPAREDGAAARELLFYGGFRCSCSDHELFVGSHALRAGDALRPLAAAGCLALPRRSWQSVPPPCCAGAGGRTRAPCSCWGASTHASRSRRYAAARLGRRAGRAAGPPGRRPQRAGAGRVVPATEAAPRRRGAFALRQALRDAAPACTCAPPAAVVAQTSRRSQLRWASSGRMLGGDPRPSTCPTCDRLALAARRAAQDRRSSSGPRERPGALAAVLPRGQLARWTGAESPAAAVDAVLALPAQRDRRRRRRAAGRGTVHLLADIDGDGRGRVASNVDGDGSRNCSRAVRRLDRSRQRTGREPARTRGWRCAGAR